MRKTDKNISVFLGCECDYETAAAAIFGAPFDSTASFRPGARFGPQAMRNDSAGLETYSPYQGADLRDCRVFDCGDSDLCIGDSDIALSQIESLAGEIYGDGKIPVMLGGEHLVTLGSVRAAVKRFPDLNVIHFDAHADLRDSYLGARLSHATVMRRCYELLRGGTVYSFCIRSGDKTEFDFAESGAVKMRKFDFAGLDEVTEKLRKSGAPVYLTVDLDCLDPSAFPGTGTPEAGGVTFLQLLGAVLEACKTDIVGADITELAPALDQSGVSTATACKLLREMLIAVTKKA